MPRLYHSLPTRDFNVHDVVFDGLTVPNGYGVDTAAILEDGDTMLFGNSNIGSNDLCNLQLPGQLHWGTAWVCNWYARTNLPPSIELDDWAHSTKVHLVVGCQPQVELSLYDLLRRSPGYRMPSDEEIGKPLTAAHDRTLEIDSVMLRANAAFQEICGTRYGIFDQPAPAVDAWRNVAKVMLETFSIPPRIVVPVRQNIAVRVCSNGQSFRVLRERMRTWGEQDPRSRMWIHLEGFAYEERLRDHKGFNAID